MDNNYSIKEVIEQRFDEMGHHLIEIKGQVTKTNGRVNRLESHRSYLWGAYTALTLLGAFIAFLLVGAIDSKVQNAVDKAITSRIDKVIEK